MYFYKFHYKESDPISEEQQARFDKGHTYGKLAHLLFPGGVDVSPPTPYDYSPAIKLTQSLLLKQQNVIYEAAFSADEVVVALDILVKRGGLHAFEVKSSISISQTVLNDAALQYYVITEAGFALEDFTIIHLKPDYKDLPSDNVQGLFINESVKEYCESQHDIVKQKIAEAKELIRSKHMPLITQGEQCNRPYPCNYKGICNRSNGFETGSLFG